jgi:histidinol-phosphatase (PHP family)
MYPVDYHTHSSYFSPDAASTMEELCEAAISKGVKELAITEHCDVNGWNGVPCDFDEELYFIALDRVREKYEDHLTLVYGLELGQPSQNSELAKRYSSNPKLDFIIGSLHNLNETEDFYFLEYPDIDACRALIERYFIELREMIEFGGFDVLGHISYPLRYIRGRAGLGFDFTEYHSEIADIFRLLIASGMGIELNTSGLRQPFGQTMPTPDIVKLYRECGGEIVTLGSDAHSAQDVGSGIPEGIAILQDAGFRYLTVYKDRKPSFVEI